MEEKEQEEEKEERPVRTIREGFMYQTNKLAERQTVHKKTETFAL